MPMEMGAFFALAVYVAVGRRQVDTVGHFTLTEHHLLAKNLCLC